MVINQSPLQGVFTVDIQKFEDERGFFARSFCQEEFDRIGLPTSVAQCNISYNHKAGTVRGMHLQKQPHAEAKLVRCTTGSIFDVVIDLRANSSTYSQWFGVTLDAAKRNAIFIPEGFAHGFQTLEDNTEVFYQMFNFFEPQSAVGLRWNDPRFNIRWPRPLSVISDKDANYPDFEDVVL